MRLFRLLLSSIHKKFYKADQLLKSCGPLKIWTLGGASLGNLSLCRPHLFTRYS